MNMTVTNRSDFELACDIFTKTGECSHNPKYFKEVRPYKCFVTIKECGVCGKGISKVYDA